MAASSNPVDNDKEKKQYKNWNDYCKTLREWTQQAHSWQCASAMFYCAAMSSSMPRPSTQQQQPQQQAPQQTQARPQQETGVEYRVPPLWKRFAAESIDFFFLFIVKLVVTFVAVDVFNIVDIEKYELELLKPVGTLDYRSAIKLSTDIFLMELLHRLFVCVFEAFCLQGGTGGQIGGCTPGKWALGLKVVRCDWCAPSLDDRVVVYPGTDLGLTLSLLRSIIKNLSLAFLFPITFTMFFFRYNRTAYDTLARSIVVDDERRQ